jgi:hypothetical protein
VDADIEDETVRPRPAATAAGRRWSDGPQPPTAPPIDPAND